MMMCKIAVVNANQADAVKTESAAERRCAGERGDIQQDSGVRQIFSVTRSQID